MMRLYLFGVLLALSCNPIFAQTSQEIATVTKIMGRPQTRASTLSYLAGDAMKKQKWTEAISCYDKMMAIYEADPGLGKDSTKFSWAQARKGLCQKAAGQLENARISCKSALTIVGGLNKENSPHEAQYLDTVSSDCSQVLSPDVVQTLLKTNTSKVLQPRLQPISESEIPDVNVRAQEVEEELSKVIDKHSMPYLKELLYLANLQCLQKKFALAEPKFKEVISVVESAAGKNSPGLATPLSNYGFMLKAAGRVKEAQEVEKRLSTLSPNTH